MDSLFKALRSPLLAEWASASAVVLVSALLGDAAREGMNTVQWLGGLAAITAAIGWAVMVRCWKPETATGEGGINR